MKRFLVFIILCMPFVSFGNCLEINGIYNCKGPDGAYKLESATKIVEGLYVYEIKDGSGGPEIFYTDGMDRPFEFTEDGMVIKGTYNSVCNADSLGISIDAKIEGMSGDVKVSLSYTLENGILHQGGYVFLNRRIFEEISENCTLIN